MMGRAMQQMLGLGTGGYVSKGKVTKRTQFLAEMDRVVPWTRLEALIAPVYPKGERGRPPLPLPVMLRVHCLQQWFNLSDPGVEEALMDIDSMRAFAGITGGADRIPDETVVLNFRRLLEKHDLAAQLFAQINAVLAEAGLMCGAHGGGHRGQRARFDRAGRIAAWGRGRGDCRLGVSVAGG